MKLHLEPKEVLELHEILCEVMPRLKDPGDMLHVDGQLRQYILACMTRGDREDKDENLKKWFDQQQEILRSKNDLVMIDRVPVGVKPANIASAIQGDVALTSATMGISTTTQTNLTAEGGTLVRNDASHQILHVDPCELDRDTYGQYPSTKNKGGHRKYGHHKKK